MYGCPDKLVNVIKVFQEKGQSVVSPAMHSLLINVVRPLSNCSTGNAKHQPEQEGVHQDQGGWRTLQLGPTTCVNQDKRALYEGASLCRRLRPDRH